MGGVIYRHYRHYRAAATAADSEMLFLGTNVTTKRIAHAEGKKKQQVGVSRSLVLKSLVSIVV